MKPNRLINATSPYLLQHALNPVDWREWNKESLAEALKHNKPILVSIGYSSCHWCHVMEKQSFENQEIADLMNEFFVCIKVDREERPDIDQVYMEAVQAMGGNGGWPLNVFLTPDQKPFFGGTYFAPKAWSQILINLNKAYREKKEQVLTSAEELKSILQSSDIERFRKPNTLEGLKIETEQSFKSLLPKFDKTWGGVEKAPKFIMPSVWQWMIRYVQLTKNNDALDHVKLTLNKIIAGGIYDQLGGGFARYSVDKEWFAPHFEKMLYDNAQLLSLYAEAYAQTKDPRYKEAVYETFEWLKREMLDKEGGWYSAIDADSEGVEGKFYVWRDEELKKVLGKDYPIAKDYFQTTDDGNWEHGNNILKRNLNKPIDKNVIETIKQKLLAVRSVRIAPGLDDKVITGWNAMTILGLTDAYRYTEDEQFLLAAQETIKFVESKLIESDILYRSYKDKRSATEGFLDDYAYVVAAYIQLHQVTLEEHYLLAAKKWCEVSIKKFFDLEDGFFFYAPTHELIARKKEVFDNVIPSSNSVMARNLIVLSSFFEMEAWRKMAEKMILDLAHVIRGELNYTGNWGMAAMELQHTFYEIVLSGNEPEKLRKEMQRNFTPFALYAKADAKSILSISQHRTSEESILYVCFNKTCNLPVHSAEEALKQLL